MIIDWEPWGIYSATALYATNDVTGLDLVLEDQASIWGTLDYSGGATGNIHVLASPLPDWDTTYSTVIPWVQAQASLTGDPVYVSFPVDYSITGLPPGEYIVRAFIDADDDGQYTHLEDGGQFAVDVLAVTNRVTGIDFAIGLDTDADGLPDWWEMQHFDGATNAVAEADDDNDGLSNVSEYQHGTDPNNADTSGDGINDGEAVSLGLEPNQTHNLQAVSPANVVIAYKHRTAERSKFTAWESFIPTNPPVYYLRLTKVDTSTLDSNGLLDESTNRLDLTVAPTSMVIVGSVTGYSSTVWLWLTNVVTDCRTTVTWTNNFGTEVKVHDDFPGGDVRTNEFQFCGVGYWETPTYGHHGFYGSTNFAGWPTNTTSFSDQGEDVEDGSTNVWSISFSAVVSPTQRSWSGSQSSVVYGVNSGYCNTNWNNSYDLSEPYTTAMLLDHGATDFEAVRAATPWSGLNWGDDVRRIMSGDPCTPLSIETNASWGYTHPARYLATNEVVFSQRESAYRFTVETASNTVYRLTWLEYFEPDATNPGGTNQFLAVRKVKFLGNGGTVHVGNPEHDPTSTSGTLATNHTFVLDPPTPAMGNGSKMIGLVSVGLSASQNLLTLKHDRECDLTVSMVTDTGFAVDSYRIDIVRTHRSQWLTLHNEAHLHPWLANIAGVFRLRGVVKIGNQECYSIPVIITNRFPSYAEIEADPEVRTWMETEWQNTLDDCTENPNRRRERGFWIQLDTLANSYQRGTVVTGEWANATHHAIINGGIRPLDCVPGSYSCSTGATYSVSFFHTHTPTTYLGPYFAPGSSRPVGPSPADTAYQNMRKVPGIVYDYVAVPIWSGHITNGHPKASTAQRYHAGDFNRRPILIGGSREVGHE
ncbi:MAG: thrombospondin type 3 repeat-containing protein [Candidatus Marinimicrobia bacterium]|nr:thrombospondin type 3 repeat-containing protein [Candidatus Neomarinimicrobiota bacterium]